MNRLFSNEAVDVYDQVLGNDDLVSLWNFMNEIPYLPAHGSGWLKVWSLSDGTILRGDQWTAEDPFWDIVPVARQHVHQGINPVPLRPLLKAVLECAGKTSRIPALKSVVMIPYVWPPNTGISWHSDGPGTDGTRVGAFTFYVHKHWNAEWGGEFMLSQVEETPAVSRVFDNSAKSEDILSTGYGIWVSPKPNCLLMNATNVLHKVARTAANAEPRLSIQGFMFA